MEKMMKKSVFLVYFNNREIVDNMVVLKVFENKTDAENFVSYWNIHNYYNNFLKIEEKTVEKFPNYHVEKRSLFKKVEDLFYKIIFQARIRKYGND
jgi:hypothetical protein